MTPLRKHDKVVASAFVGAFLFPNLVIAVEALFVPRYVIAGLLAGAAYGTMVSGFNIIFGAMFGCLTAASFVARRTALKWAGSACVIWAVLILVLLGNAYSIGSPETTQLLAEKLITQTEANWREKDLFIQTAPHLIWAIFLLFRGAKLLTRDRQEIT